MATESSLENELKTSSCTVMVVEDDEAILSSIKGILNFKGYEVETAQNGQIALDLLEKLGNKRPCLILLDLMMPVMDGWKFLEEIRKRPEYDTESLPVVITSAARINEEAQSKAQGYLSKPVRMQNLLETVANYCPPALK